LRAWILGIKTRAPARKKKNTGYGEGGRKVKPGQEDPRQQNQNPAGIAKTEGRKNPVDRERAEQNAVAITANSRACKDQAPHKVVGGH